LPTFSPNYWRNLTSVASAIPLDCDFVIAIMTLPCGRRLPVLTCRRVPAEEEQMNGIPFSSPATSWLRLHFLPPHGTFTFDCISYAHSWLRLHFLPPHGTFTFCWLHKCRLRTMRRSIDVCDVTSLASHVIIIITCLIRVVQVLKQNTLRCNIIILFSLTITAWWCHSSLSFTYREGHRY
jgi:hypothetical protein